MAHFAGAHESPTRRCISSTAFAILHGTEFNYLGESSASVDEINDNHQFIAMGRTSYIATLRMKYGAFGLVKRFYVLSGMAGRSSGVVRSSGSSDESRHADDETEVVGPPSRLGRLRCSINRLPLKIQSLIFWIPLLMGLAVGARGAYVICRNFWPDGRNALLILLSGPISSAGAGVLIWAVHTIPYGYCG